MKESLEKALNEQVKAELSSAYLYLSMAAYLDSVNLKGAAHWMKVQVNEELGHMMKFFDFINGRSGKVVLDALEKPKDKWNSILDVFETTYEHEVKVSSMINNLFELATREKDYAVANFLQWFISEQVEEENSTLEIVKMLRMVKDSNNGIIIVDKELHQRGS